METAEWRVEMIYPTRRYETFVSAETEQGAIDRASARIRSLPIPPTGKPTRIDAQRRRMALDKASNRA